MAHVEIYKLRDTAPAAIRDMSVHDHIKHSTIPDPANYIKEWAGEMHGTLPLTISGRLYTDRKHNYRGKHIKNGDIAVVDGKPYYFDSLEGSKFIEIDSFDGSNARAAIQVNFGWPVDISEAVEISDSLAVACDKIDVPFGFRGESHISGIFADMSEDLAESGEGNRLILLHPEFLKGDEAQDFADLLEKLSQTEGWQDIVGYLRERSPVTIRDLEDAREHFAPELLLPKQLLPFHKDLPSYDVGIETNYLAAFVSDMGEEQFRIFSAAMEAGWHDSSTSGIINLAKNTDCFFLMHALNEEQYGELKLKDSWQVVESAMDRLMSSNNPVDRFLAEYTGLLARSADAETFGRHAAKEDGGIFTRYGYITQTSLPETLYEGVQDIPKGFGMLSVPSAVYTEKIRPRLMVCDTDLTALLVKIHATSGDYMKDSKRNIQTIANDGDTFFALSDGNTLTITPADTLFRRDLEVWEKWMTVDEAGGAKAFALSVKERNPETGLITGDLYETVIGSVQNSLRGYGIFFTHFNAEMIDGSVKQIPIEDWDLMGVDQRRDIKSLERRYDPSDEARFREHVNTVIRVCKGSSLPSTSEEYISRINEVYMAKAKHPQNNMLRLSPVAAKEILARGMAHVFSLQSNHPARLLPVDAAKKEIWHSVPNRAFAVKENQGAAIDAWAERTAKEAIRDMERSGLIQKPAAQER